MACTGCARRRKYLKKYIKTLFKGKKTVSTTQNNVITNKFVKKMNSKYGK